jgi:hypothetical protein
MTERNAVLDAALRDLGARLDVPTPPDPGELTEAVRARLAGPPRGGRAPFGGPVLLRVAAVLVAALIALGVLITVSPPVRAAVFHLLRFAGIEFSSESAPPPSTLPTTVTLPGERSVDLPTARRLSRFPVPVPEALGTPEKVLLADGTPPRIVSLVYRGGTVRLDEFDGRIDQALFKKIAGGEGVQWVQAGGDFGVWVDRPHEVIYVDRDGKYHTESARLSGKTLIWTAGDVTLRLEGDLTLDEALAVARSVR